MSRTNPSRKVRPDFSLADLLGIGSSLGSVYGEALADGLTVFIQEIKQGAAGVWARAASETAPSPKSP